METSRRAKKLPRVLTEEQLTELLKQANRRSPTGARNLAVMLLMGRCGLRVSEVTALKSSHVTADSITVKAKAEGRNKTEDAGGAKGDRERVVPLDPQTAQAVDAWRAVRRKLGLRSHTLFVTITDRGEGEVTLPAQTRTMSFATEPGRPLSRQYVTQMVKNYARRAGLNPALVSSHVLRHTAATTWLRAGFNLREVQQLLGHSSPATTEVYTHVFSADLQRKQQALSPLAL
jgi:integrase/recombinase XerD